MSEIALFLSLRRSAKACEEGNFFFFKLIFIFGFYEVGCECYALTSEIDNTDKRTKIDARRSRNRQLCSCQNSYKYCRRIYIVQNNSVDLIL